MLLTLIICDDMEENNAAFTKDSDDVTADGVSQKQDEERDKNDKQIDKLPKPVQLDLPAMGLEFHPKELLLAASFIDGTVKLYDCVEQEETEELWSSKEFKKSCRAVRFAEDGSTLISISKDKSWKIFDVETGEMSKAYPRAHDAGIYSVAMAGANFVVTGDDDGRLKLWDLRQEKCVFEAKENEDYLSDLAVDDNNKIVLATSGDGTLSSFNIKRRRFDLQSENLNNDLTCIELTRRGQKVVCGCSDGSLNFFNWGEFGDISDRFPGHPESIDFSCKIRDDIICTGSGDGLIRAVNLFPHRFLGVIGDHDDLPVNNLTIDSESVILASCGHDQKIKFWDVEHFHQLGKLEKRKSKASDVNKRLTSSGTQENFFSDLLDES